MHLWNKLRNLDKLQQLQQQLNEAKTELELLKSNPIDEKSNQFDNWFRDARDVLFTKPEIGFMEKLGQDQQFKHLVSKLHVLVTQKYLYDLGDTKIFHGTLQGLDMIKNLSQPKKKQQINHVTGKAL